MCKVSLPSCLSIEIFTKDTCYMYSGSVRESASASTHFALKKKYYVKSKEMFLYTQNP